MCMGFGWIVVKNVEYHFSVFHAHPIALFQFHWGRWHDRTDIAELWLLRRLLFTETNAFWYGVRLMIMRIAWCDARSHFLFVVNIFEEPILALVLCMLIWLFISYFCVWIMDVFKKLCVQATRSIFKSIDYSNPNLNGLMHFSCIFLKISSWTWIHLMSHHHLPKKKVI